MSLGERLKEIRMEKGFTLTQAADALGVARTAYRLWEIGAASPSPEYWKEIAFWCELPIVTIMRELGHIDDEEERKLLELSVRQLGPAIGAPPRAELAQLADAAE